MKEQVEELIEKLKCNKYIDQLSTYSKNDSFWDCYYTISGWHKEEYFLMSINKAKDYEWEFKISQQTTHKPYAFLYLLSTITNLEFKIK